MIFSTVEEVKAHYKNDGYFDHSVINEFKTKLFDKVYNNKYFITFELNDAGVADSFKYKIVAINHPDFKAIATIYTADSFEEAENKINEFLIKEIIA